jgi:hypothetical protein
MFFNVLTANPLPKLDPSSQKAIQYAQTAQQKGFPAKITNEGLLPLLPDYSFQNDMALSIASFSSQISAVPLEQLQVDPISIGWSGDNVYRVQNQLTKKTILIVKVFSVSSQNLLRELYSLAFIASLDLPNLDPIRILGLGKMSVDEQPSIFLAESIAKGEKLADIIDTTADIPIDKPERELAFEKLTHLFYLTGISLAEFHNVKSSKPKKIHETVIAELKRQYDRAVDKLRASPQNNLNMDLLAKYFAHIVKANQTEKHPYGLVHSDAHFDNLFYDIDESTLTLLDPGTVSYSIDQKGHPIGMPAKDYHKILENINVLKLTADEKLILTEMFQEGYITGGGKSPTETQNDFLKFRDELEVVGVQLGSPHENEEWWQKIIKPILARNLIDLIQRLEKFSCISDGLNGRTTTK